jgi:hypothetical protein
MPRNRSQDRFRVGDSVVVRRVPDSVAALPPDVRRLFHAVVGRPLRVDDVDAERNCVALNVREDGSQAPDWTCHTIWVEAEAATPATEADA